MNLVERLDQGPVLCAEGYLFAMERRGYLQAGAYVPEVVLEHPEVVTQLHREFIRAGSDVVQAFNYYGHREKLRIIGKEHLLEPMQKNALQIAKDAANEFKDLEVVAKAKGFLLVSSSPLTRSSYHADEDFAKLKKNRITSNAKSFDKEKH